MKDPFISIKNEQLKEIIENIYCKDKLTSLFLKLLFVSGARACELQNLKLRNIKKENDKSYKVFIELAKKTNIEFREILISKDFFKEVQSAHKEHFKNKKFDYLHRTYFFQKTKGKKVSINTISHIFKIELENQTKRKIDKSLHIFRHNYIRTMKENNFNIYEIMNDLKLSNFALVSKVYGHLFVDRKRNFDIMNNAFNQALHPNLKLIKKDKDD